MAKPGKRASSASVDEASVDSFPASDPPSWTLGSSDATASVAPAALPGTLAAPASGAAEPSPAELVRGTQRWPSLDVLFAGAGVMSVAGGMVLSLTGKRKLGSTLSRGGTALLLLGVFSRLGNRLSANAGTGAAAPSYH